MLCIIKFVFFLLQVSINFYEKNILRVRKPECFFLFCLRNYFYYYFFHYVFPKILLLQNGTASPEYVSP